MKPHSAIIIGAGIGGITTAAHLARRGVHVTVFEKNQRPGGRCDHFSREGHEFDTGPTLMVMPLVYEAAFAALGASMAERLELQRVDPTYHLVFDDGSRLNLTSDMGAMYRQLEAIEPGSYDGFLRYMEEGHRHYHVGMSRLAERDFRRAAQFFNIRNLPLLFQVKPLVPHYRHMRSFFSEPRLRSAFTFQDVYMGLSPYEAPSTFSMMPYTEMAHGVWYPKGGMYRIVQALTEIALEQGVEFEFEASIERIEVSNGRTTGIVLADGRRVTADMVIANADLPYVYEHLLPEQHLANRMAHKHYSCSVISFFWGVDKPYPELGPHTLFLADDYHANFDSIIKHLTLPENPSLYVHAPARLNPKAAPAGEDTLIGIVPVGHLSAMGEQDWVDLREQARQAVFNRLALLGITDLEQHIKFETNFTPLSWRKRYNLTKGSTHGLSHTLTQLGYLRPHNRHPRYHNLYFVGASTHPGTGIPSALISARHVANRAYEELVM
ncbi:MAG: phytoene desaturase [Anaerolineae bacterium]|nr:phytoene desaturase [Anaerolineae bacterium]